MKWLKKHSRNGSSRQWLEIRIEVRNIRYSFMVVENRKFDLVSIHT